MIDASAIHVSQLVKRYKNSKSNAVDGVSFEVSRGEIFGLLGPNGAGKTTTIGVLTTSILPTSGSASLMGVDIALDPIEAKRRIAVVPQQSNLDRSLKVREILTFHAAYHGVARKQRETRASQLLDELGLGISWRGPAGADRSAPWCDDPLHARGSACRVCAHRRRRSAQTGAREASISNCGVEAMVQTIGHPRQSHAEIHVP